MIVDDGRVADGLDRRYQLYSYQGLADTLRQFLGDQPLSAALEVGCGTGRWLPAAAAQAALAVGMDASETLLARARTAAPAARFVRARAEALPWRDGSFDRIACINALHHFSSRGGFLEEALRVLAAGGSLLTVGLDPHTGLDSWWVYDYFPEALALDRERFAPVRLIRAEMTKAGFLWAESFEAEHVELQLPASDVAPGGALERGLTSQLVRLDDEAWARGRDRLQADMAAAGGALTLAADLRLYATIGQVAER